MTRPEVETTSDQGSDQNYSGRNQNLPASRAFLRYSLNRGRRNCFLFATRRPMTRGCRHCRFWFFDYRCRTPRFSVTLQALQVRSHVRRRLVAEPFILFHKLRSARLQFRRNVWVQSHWGHRSPVQTGTFNESGTSRRERATFLWPSRIRRRRMKTNLYVHPNLWHPTVRLHVGHCPHSGAWTRKMFFATPAVASVASGARPHSLPLRCQLG